MDFHCTLARSMLLARASTGNALRPASNTGAPSVFPFRSAGDLMPLFLSASTAEGVDSYTMKIACGLVTAPGLLPMNSISAEMSAKPMS